MNQESISSFQENMVGGAKGSKVVGEISGRRYTRESFVAALYQKKIIAPFCYNGTCDTTLFNFWLENFLLPELGPGYILIMDIAAFHKSEQTKLLIENAECLPFIFTSIFTRFESY